MSLIRSEIKKVRASLDYLGRSALSAHLKLATIISKDLWSIIDARAALKAINEHHITEKREQKKLSSLLQKSHYKVEELNINLSDAVRNDEPTQVLDSLNNNTHSGDSLDTDMHFGEQRQYEEITQNKGNLNSHIISMHTYHKSIHAEQKQVRYAIERVG